MMKIGKFLKRKIGNLYHQFHGRDLGSSSRIILETCSQKKVQPTAEVRYESATKMKDDVFRVENAIAAVTLEV